MASDEATRLTNDDATNCKYFAASKGYLHDDYIQYFARNIERKAPEINRGYFARVKTVRVLLDQFLKLTGNSCQIVNLGAGYDTLFWRLRDEGMLVRNFCEIDFHEVVTRKCHVIKSRQPLLEKLACDSNEIVFSGSDIHSPNYHLIGADLRNMVEVEQKLHEADIDLTLPTVFLAECVLVYMPVPQSARLISWIAQNFKSAVFINYEQINMKDRFGEVMIQNLQARDCRLPGVDCCQNVDTQRDRFVCNGWTACHVTDMFSMYQHLPQEEVQRIEQLEFLDEIDLIEQLFRHYCICLAFKDELNLGLDTISLMPG